MAAKLKGYVKTLDEIADKALQDLYVEVDDPKGGKRFKLDADEVEDVTGLKSTVAVLRREAKDFKDKLEPLATLPADADVAAILAAGQAELDRRAGGKPIPEVESIRTQLTTAHKKETDKLRAQVDGMTATLRETLIENAVREAASDPNIKGNAKLLLPHFGSTATDIVATEDPVTGKLKYSAVVLGADRKPLVDSKGEPVTIKARLAEMREDKDYYGAFEGSGSSGSGGTPVGGGGMPELPLSTGAKPDAKTAKVAAGDYNASL